MLFRAGFHRQLLSEKAQAGNTLFEGEKTIGAPSLAHGALRIERDASSQPSPHFSVDFGYQVPDDGLTPLHKHFKRMAVCCLLL